MLNWFVRHSRAITIGSLPLGIVLLDLAVVFSPWYYAVLATWVFSLVALAARLERAEPGSMTPKKQRWADMPYRIGWGVAVSAYTIVGGLILLWTIFKLRRL